MHVSLPSTFKPQTLTATELWRSPDAELLRRESETASSTMNLSWICRFPQIRSEVWDSICFLLLQNRSNENKNNVIKQRYTDPETKFFFFFLIHVIGMKRFFFTSVNWRFTLQFFKLPSKNDHNHSHTLQSMKWVKCHQYNSVIRELTVTLLK